MAGTVVIIPARMGSARLPGKPLADICGRSLILRVLDGVAGSGVSRIVVATDSNRICSEVTAAGYEAVITGPAENGTQRVYAAWKILGSPEGRIINLQGDEPGVDHRWIDALLSVDMDPMTVATLAGKTDMEKAADPSVVKVVFRKDRRALYFSRSIIPWSGEFCFQHVGVYCFTHTSLPVCACSPAGRLSSAEKLEQLSWMENGVDVSVVTGEWNGLGVDTPEDLEEARRWFGNC